MPLTVASQFYKPKLKIDSFNAHIAWREIETPQLLIFKRNRQYFTHCRVHAQPFSCFMPSETDANFTGNLPVKIYMHDILLF
jgi:hypothetical protein